MYVTPTSSTWALEFNTRAAPFTDVRVRQAISYAVDRTQEAALLSDDSQPACQILPSGLPGYRRYCPYTIDPHPAGAWNAPGLACAERLIQASGTRGTPITIWDLVAPDPPHLAPAISISSHFLTGSATRPHRGILGRGRHHPTARRRFAHRAASLPVRNRRVLPLRGAGPPSRLLLPILRARLKRQRQLV
jgi:hypothetical protein